jgi:UDP-glucose 4-epimerase
LPVCYDIGSEPHVRPRWGQIVRIVVTGAAGFIASNLIPRLLADGHDVVGVDNLFLGKKAHLDPVLGNARFQFREQDLLPLQDTVDLFRSVQPDLVWHLAANSDISYGTTHTDFDLKGGTIVTYNVLEAMRLSGARQIIFSSSGAVYGEPTVMPTPEVYGPLLPISLYAASKLACEGLVSAYAHNYDIQAWIFRFGNIVGPNPTHGAIYDFVLKLRKDSSRLRVLGDGTQSKQYVYVEDCLDGMLHGYRAANEPLNYFNLSAEGHTSVRYMAERTLLTMGLDTVPIEYSGGSRGWRGDVPVVRLDASKLAKVGWKPRFSSDEAVDRAIGDAVRQLGASDRS